MSKRKDEKRRLRAKLKRGAGRQEHNRPGYDPKAKAREAKARVIAETNARAAARECGTCTACCTVLGIPSLQKPAWTPCSNLCDKGCSIYDARPTECREYVCFWRQGYGEENDRPDDLGVVIGTSTAPALVQIAVGRGVPRFTNDIVFLRESKPGAFKTQRVRAHVDRILLTGGVCAFVHEREAVTVFGPACPTGFYLLREAMEAWNREAAAKRGEEPRPVFRDDAAPPTPPSSPAPG